MLTLAACSEEMSDSEIRAAAADLGMMTEAEAQAMAAGMAPEPAMMTDQEVMDKAKEMGMVMEGDAMMMTGDRLAQVRERDKVICASRNDVPGYGYLDSSGNNVGFDIDLCRALAAAVLGDSEQDRDPPDLGRRARPDDPVR